MPVKLTIIGAGPGGYVAAVRAAQKGAQVTVVAEGGLGGTCLHRGCIPTKAFIASAETLKSVRSAGEFGVVVSGEVLFDLARIRERKDKIIATQVKGIQALFKSWGITHIPARGSLLSPDVVRSVRQDGTTQDIKSDRIIIATGSRPAPFPGLPFDGTGIISSDDAVQMRSVPKSLLIIGAGVIGCEFAFLYRALGSEVTLVETMQRVLATEDAEISGIIERELKKAKIRLHAGSGVSSVAKSDNDMLRVKITGGNEIVVETVLVAVGRNMNTVEMGLDECGVGTGERGEITVNDRMETGVPGVYAVGDVTGQRMLAHVASHQGLVAAENALGGDARTEYDAVPAGIFTMPEVGSVGLTEEQAAQERKRVRIGRFQYRGLGKAHIMGEIAGMVKVIADETTDRVLGVHICGAHATDLINESSLAIKLGAKARDIAETVHAHPTLSEAIMEAAGDVHRAAVHIPRGGR